MCELEKLIKKNKKIASCSENYKLLLIKICWKSFLLLSYTARLEVCAVNTSCAKRMMACRKQMSSDTRMICREHVLIKVYKCSQVFPVG